jgi:hypothetical protein
MSRRRVTRRQAAGYKGAMPTKRSFTVAVAVLFGMASLLVSGAAGYASPDSAGASSASHAGGPNPNAPRGGRVIGVQTGPHISFNNAASRRAFLELHQQMLGVDLGAPATPDTIHEYVGTSFDNIADSEGSQATQSVSTKIKPANPGTTLYTPTMYPSGGSCVEVSTAYFHTSQVVAAWDWCVQISFAAQVTINQAFMQTYTQNKNYSTQIVMTNKATNEWSSYLYNYTTGQWDLLFKQHGTSQVGLAEGWDLYELYSELKSNGQSYACADLKKKRVESQDIQVRIGSTWFDADPAHAGDDYDVPIENFHCKSLHYSMITQFTHWKAKG